MITIKKGIKVLLIAMLVLLVYLIVIYTIASFISLVYVDVDVAKRIESPDRSKTALLIRRSAFDLNFYIEIKDGFFSKDLHKSKDFLPDSRVDWNEELIWSYDSSFLVISVDNKFDEEEKYIWAYDFNENKEYTDVAEIMELLNSRNEGKENPVEAMYQW